MSLFFVKTRIKLLFTTSFFVAFLFLPVALFCVYAALEMGSEGAIRVGLIYEDSGVAKKVAESFVEYAKDYAQIVSFENTEALKEEVLKGNVDCGYVIEGVEKIRKIQLIKSPLTMSSEVFNLILASGVIENMSFDLAYSLLKEYVDPVQLEEMQHFITGRTEEYLKQKDEIVKFKKFGEYNIHNENIYIKKTAYFGVLALFALIFSLMFTGILLKEKKDGVYKCIIASGIKLSHYFTWNMAVMFGLNFCVFILGFLAFEGKGLVAYIGLTVGYLLALSGLSLLLVTLLKSDLIIMPIIIFSFFTTVLFGGVIFDIREVFGSLEFLSNLFICNYFVQGLNKSNPIMEILILLCFAITLFLWQRINFLKNL